MSIKYPALPNTTYPDKIQIFEEKLNITPNDATLIKQVQQLIEQRKFAEANAIRQQIPNYKQKQLVVKDWNEMSDTVVALQLEYDSRYTPSYILSKEKPDNQSEGDYWYRITNIKYIGETEEIGTGEKSPDNPYELKGQKVPNTELELYSLPNGVSDEYDEVSKTYIKKIEKLTIDGSQDMGYNTGILPSSNITRWGVLLDKPAKTVIKETINTSINLISSRFNPISYTELMNSQINFGVSYNNGGDRIYFAVNPPFATEIESQEWFKTHPTVVLYELETPEIIQL